MEPSSVYTDGGVLVKNPSLLGGTWAYCWVDLNGNRIKEASGTIPANPWLPYGGITNNTTELAAVIYALESLPDGWDGTLYTDSQVTISRIYRIGSSDGTYIYGVPQRIVERLAFVLKRMGKFSIKRLGGHPTKQELLVGFRRDGSPVSVHNVWADKACTAAGRTLILPQV